MKWSINFSKDALAFLKQEKIAEEEVLVLMKNTLEKFRGEDTNIDIKKLHGEWAGFHRIRKGKIRVIAEFNFSNFSVYIERIDWRGNVYK